MNNSFKIKILVLAILTLGVGWLALDRFYFGQRKLPKGDSVPLEEFIEQNNKNAGGGSDAQNTLRNGSDFQTSRQIFVTDGVKHSVPLDEILSGGPSKDGIPSIDNPKFISPNEVDYLTDEDVGQGLCNGDDCRFYPYQILVWHEIVNDTVGGKPALVTYCPLCFTGIVFDPVVGGKHFDFGTSGRLWKSNLVMYNRSEGEDNESLWSQVLGEAIVGPHTGIKLKIIRSDTVKYGDWKKLHPDTRVLSRDTGHFRTYGRDPYGDYYTSSQVGFGADFNDDQLHPKAYVVGIEINGQFKAYNVESLKVGTTNDSFANKEIIITKSGKDEISIIANSDELPFIGGFWFSWLVAHPKTELFQ
ncbi:MAG: hypothetical protein COV29_01715 [Candidatus Yanofskybacteria bacterium CG10_big_fil_rev_8_21_14_0_10_36_16]|uniref:DUF3179 domain-containing protein n=1 Tax=Candidatus Yanofskybacteria bacterium CG10_big_fil_rev_8_21_14_0_10_36_16 TaxID=1975096 RepID=A0A2J0Q7C4_9BACT|nr:MAG: hypothetical protein COV29_01715 [Candidatus Yanofskybacteria bacterium CG10_big_fil_rev_8_21_14_0_10_36_16]